MLGGDRQESVRYPRVADALALLAAVSFSSPLQAQDILEEVYVYAQKRVQNQQVVPESDQTS